LPFFNLGYIEILLIVAVVLALFVGPSRLSGVIRPLNKGLQEYKKLSHEVNEIKETFSLKNILDTEQEEDKEEKKH